MVSLDNINVAGKRMIEAIADPYDQYEGMMLKEEISTILDIINNLCEEDRDLITNLLIKNKTERELAQSLNVSQPVIHKRKVKIIKKIKEKIQ